MITLTIPNDDHIALRAFGKALEEMALAHGAPSTQLQVVNEITMSGEQSEALRERLKEVLGAPRDEIAEQAGINPAVADAYVQGCHDTEARLVETDTTAQQVESLGNKEWPKEQCPVTGAVHDVDPSEVPHSTLLEHGIDSTGTPWDARIHSASKALNADGTWRLRRKPKDMDEAEWAAFVESVKAERHISQPQTVSETSMILGKDGDISINTGAVSVSFDPAHDEPPVTPPGDDFHTDAGVVTEETVAGIPPLPVPPPVVVAPPVPEVTTWDFPRLMTFLTERHGKIDVATVNTLLAQDGVSSVQELNARPDKIGPFVARVKAHLGE